MRARKTNTIPTVVQEGKNRLMSTEEMQAYMSPGRNRAMELGEEIGAKIKIGRRVLWDRVKIDQYLNSLTGV